MGSVGLEMKKGLPMHNKIIQVKGNTSIIVIIYKSTCRQIDYEENNMPTKLIDESIIHHDILNYC